MVTVTLLQICYLCHSKVNEWTWLRQLDIFNEAVVLSLSTSYLIATDVAMSRDQSLKLGTLIILQIVLLICVNSLIIFRIAIQEAQKRYKKYKAKKEST